MQSVSNTMVSSVRLAAKSSSVPVSRVPVAVRVIGAAPLFSSCDADMRPPSDSGAGAGAGGFTGTTRVRAVVDVAVAVA